MAEALLAALTAPSISLQLDLRGANFCNCCNRTNSDDTMVIVGNAIKPRTVSCWEKVFCCCKNKDRIQGKEAVKHYFESHYDTETASRAFAQANINFNQINSITSKESRKIQQNVNDLWKEKSEKRHSFLLEQIEDHRPSYVFKERDEEEEKATEKITPEELRRERNLVRHTLTLKSGQFKRPITEIQIEEIVNNAIRNVVVEDGETITMKKIHLKVMEQLKNEGYVVARSPRSPIGRKTFQPPTPTPSPHK